jgi:hypothetical protein
MKTFTLPEIINFLSKHHVSINVRNTKLWTMTTEMIKDGSAIVEDATWTDNWKQKNPEIYPLTFEKKSWSVMDGYIEVDNNQLKLAIKVYESDSFGHNISQTAYFLLIINDTRPTIQKLVEQEIYHIANEAIAKQDEEKAQKRQRKMEQSIINGFI